MRVPVFQPKWLPSTHHQMETCPSAKPQCRPRAPLTSDADFSNAVFRREVRTVQPQIVNAMEDGDDDMLFDMEIADVGDEEECEDVDDCAGIDATVSALLEIVKKPQDPFLVKLKKVVTDIVDALPNFDLKEVAKQLSNQNYSIRIRSVSGSNDIHTCLETLRHSYLVIKMPFSLKNGLDEVIVDPGFRQQFVIAQPTEEYQNMLEKLPSTFVGPIGALWNVAGWVCEQLEKSFLKSGRLVPPWRRSGSILSKWKGQDFQDQEVAAAPAVFDHRAFDRAKISRFTSGMWCHENGCSATYTPIYNPTGVNVVTYRAPGAA
ncbi:hypothetical protein BSKO_03734 [Bryopsis sp. KO-2023]|nr:hypothetical protein BSKO_03734 [Bryopsis sp. KO-2023]